MMNRRLLPKPVWRRAFAQWGILLTLLSYPLAPVLRAEVCQCRPALYGSEVQMYNFAGSGAHHVCFEGTDPNTDHAHGFNDDEMVAFQAGVEECVNVLLNAQGLGAWFVFDRDYNDCQPEEGDFVVSRNQNYNSEGPQGAHPVWFNYAGESGGGVQFAGNTEWLTADVDDWKWVAAHETLHTLGLRDAYDNGDNSGTALSSACQSKTLMGSNRPGGWSSKGEKMGCDQLALVGKLLGDGNGSGSSEVPDDSEDTENPGCYIRDVFIVTLCWGDGWYVCDEYWGFSYRWCP